MDDRLSPSRSARACSASPTAPRSRRDLVVRPVDMRQFDRDLGIVKDIYRTAWEDNWGFVPPTDAEIRQLAVDLKPIIDPELVLFAERRGGRSRTR